MITRRGPLLRLAAIAAISALAVSGCVSGNQPGGGDGGDKSTSSSPNPSGGRPSQPQALQTHVFNDPDATLKLELLSLGRINNNVLKLQIRLTALSGDSVLASTFGNNDYAETFLADGASMKAYFPLVTQQDTMLFSPSDNRSLYSGQSRIVTVFYPSPPANVSKVDIMYPSGPPFPDVTIAPSAQVEKGEPDPTKLPLKSPRIEDMISRVDDLSGNKSIDEGSNGQDIRLNTDVLFALNKATLTDKAEGILKDVASRIDKASTKTIKVDGYTDSSGNDAINDPLSRRRAEAVAGELKKLLTRSGVAFQTAGHGSADPVATNSTSEGRQKNRRVTVTIGK